MYQRHLSEPPVPQGFKQEMVEPRYPEQGVPGMGPPRAAPFHPIRIKKEPRDFCFDSGVCLFVGVHAYQFRDQFGKYLWYFIIK